MKKETKADSVHSEFKNLTKQERIEKTKIFSDKFCVGNNPNFKLSDHTTIDDLAIPDKTLDKLLEMGVETMADLQDVLYAQDKWSLLLVFQAMDAAGKDGAIKHVMSGINPQGCQVSSFKAPSHEDLEHDFLWRCQKHLPERGRIGIFNRSYYEEVLVVRVHKQFLENQKIPHELVTETIWEERYEDIRNFEKYLHRNGTKVIKFFLNVSKEEQKNRFIERIDNPDKNWKFSTGDIKERAYWDHYMDSYEQLIQNTSTENAPWYVVPADNKEYSRVVIAAAIITALQNMNLNYPVVDQQKTSELIEIRKKLLLE